MQDLHPDPFVTNGSEELDPYQNVKDPEYYYAAYNTKNGLKYVALKMGSILLFTNIYTTYIKMYLRTRKK